MGQHVSSLYDGTQHVLTRDFSVVLGPCFRSGPAVAPGAVVAAVPGFVRLYGSSVLHVREGYMWDGASGPVIDTVRNKRAALVHDVLYQLLREGRLSQARRKDADAVFRDLCIEDGTWRIVAHARYVGLRLFGERYARCKNG